MERISIIIVSWNVEKTLNKCVDSILATNYPNLEVFVVDNASNDSSAKIAKSYSQIFFIQNTQNLGFPKGVNIGLRQSTGKYILILNPDTILPHDFFKQSISFFSLHPEAWLMGPRFKNPDGTSQGSVFNESSVLATFQESWAGKKDLTGKYSPSQTSSVFAVSGGCMFFPRTTLERIGLFTEDVFMYFEDMDYCRRIHALGGIVYYNPQISIIHEHGHSSKQLPRANPEVLPFWKGYLWESSLWYNGPLKHYLMTAIAWTGQKLHKLFS